uniref:Uncharacterized protein n=1 Tax=Amphimedon queenslandica TaxID=400682 RepID=A0A1X7TTY6_AMPQE
MCQHCHNHNNDVFAFPTRYYRLGSNVVPPPHGAAWDHQWLLLLVMLRALHTRRI